MPTLPVEAEGPTRMEQVTDAGRRIGAAIGADARVTLRLLVFFVAAALGSSMAPVPWAQIALIALLGIAIDVARRRTHE